MQAPADHENEELTMAQQVSATATRHGDFVFDPYSMEYALDPYPF